METKVIVLPTVHEKIKKERVVTQTKQWINFMNDNDFDPINQYHFVVSLDTYDDSIDIDEKIKKKKAFLTNQIQDKIKGYKTQDIQKHIFDQEEFIDFPFVLKKLKESKLHCYYCKEHMLVWYKQSRYPKQWSLERIDNTMGHNKNNVEISCLSCNISRRCMYHDRFRFTKQLHLIKSNH
jgi:hypothetical protein